MYLDLAGLQMALREAAVALGAATLQLRAGNARAGALLVTQALQRIVAAESDADRLARTHSEDEQ
jgi:hypothetical protein